MRRKFFKLLYDLMKQDRSIYALTGDLGYGGFDRIMRDFPDRFLNTGASEQSLMGIAVGLAMSGKKVFVYSITPFLLWRAAETIRNYVDHESCPVCLMGAGRDNNYEIDGYSHFAGDDEKLMEGFKNIFSVWPEDNEQMEVFVKSYLDVPKPTYINLVR